MNYFLKIQRTKAALPFDLSPTAVKNLALRLIAQSEKTDAALITRHIQRVYEKDGCHAALDEIAVIAGALNGRPTTMPRAEELYQWLMGPVRY